jgi:hypothetical protein
VSLEHGWAIIQGTSDMSNRSLVLVNEEVATRVHLSTYLAN